MHQNQSVVKLTPIPETGPSSLPFQLQLDWQNLTALALTGARKHQSSPIITTSYNRDPLYLVVPISVIYATIFVTGLIGNVSTCIVIARNKFMHTATNYYLFSLAVSDLLLLISGLPSEMWYIWSNYPYAFGETFCAVQSFAAETSANATVLTITAFTVERYVAICHPFLSHTMSKLSRAIRYIVVIWLLALCLAVPQAIQFGIVYQKFANGSQIESSATCSVKPTSIQHAFEISSVLFFVVPMFIIVVLYMLIGLKLKNTRMLSIANSRNTTATTPSCDYYCQSDCGRSKVAGGGGNGGGGGAAGGSGSAQRNVIRMLVAVVVAFFICWAPFHAQRLLAVYAERNKKDERKTNIVLPFYTALTYISGVLYYLSTTINPLLYNIMSNKFREAFKSMLSKHCDRRRRRLRHRAPNNKSSPCRFAYNNNNSSISCPARYYPRPTTTILAADPAASVNETVTAN